MVFRQLHGEVARKMWGDYKGICEITAITNAQNKTYWSDPELDKSVKRRMTTRRWWSERKN